MEAWFNSLLQALALPEYGLSTVFVVAFVSATLLPLGSEPAVFGLIKLNPELFWPAILIATAGNTQRFNAISWAVTSIANAISGNDYMEFTITPGSGYQFDVSSIVVQWQRSGTGNSAISLRSSVDGYASDLGGVWTLGDLSTTQTNTFTFTQNASTAPVTYRFYS